MKNETFCPYAHQEKERQSRPKTMSYWALQIATQDVDEVKREYVQDKPNDEDPWKIWRVALMGLSTGIIYHHARPRIEAFPAEHRHTAPQHHILRTIDTIFDEETKKWIKRTDVLPKNYLQKQILDELTSLKDTHQAIKESILAGIDILRSEELALTKALSGHIHPNSERVQTSSEVTTAVERSYRSLLNPHASLHFGASEAIVGQVGSQMYKTDSGEIRGEYKPESIVLDDTAVYYAPDFWEDIRQINDSSREKSKQTGCPAHLSSRITRLVFDPTSQPPYANVIHGLHMQFVDLLRQTSQ